MQMIKLPRTITKKIDQIQRNFIWGSTSEKRKLHMVKWKVVTSKKNEEGLGVQRSETKNLALLSKLAWRAFQQPNLPWASVLLRKYSSNMKLDKDTKANSTHRKL